MKTRATIALGFLSAFVMLAGSANQPASASAQPAGGRGLTGAPQLARVYDAIMDARFDQAAALLAHTCSARPSTTARSSPPPAEVCQLLDVVSLWWQIQLDPHNTTRDARFRARVDAAVASLESWTTREPRRAEAWFYLGGAYGARAEWRVLRGERVAAARDGKRIKDALERALAIDPGLQDAYFGIGLYHYYADVAPAAARLLRWLLLLPGGDRAQGLDEMLRARNSGQLLRSEADYQLHLIYLWYEKQPERALDLLRELSARHPHNPHFLQLTAEVQDVYLHDATASLRAWQALLDAARAGQVAEPDMAEARARLGLALQLDRLFESDAAIPHLRAVIDRRPAAPFAAVAQAHLQLGQVLDRLGMRGDAMAAYRAAAAAAPAGDPTGVGEQARDGLRHAPSPGTAAAFRLSLEAWRATERGAFADAARALREARALRADDRVAQYREARLLAAQGHDTAALAAYESVIAAGDATPPTFLGYACVEAALSYERRGQPARAIELYRTAHTLFGADQRSKDIARRALIRLAAL